MFLLRFGVRSPPCPLHIRNFWFLCLFAINGPFPRFVLRSGIFILHPNSFCGSSNALQLNPDRPCQKRDRHRGCLFTITHGSASEVSGSAEFQLPLYITLTVFLFFVFKSQGLEKPVWCTHAHKILWKIGTGKIYVTLMTSLTSVL